MDSAAVRARIGGGEASTKRDVTHKCAAHRANLPSGPGGAHVGGPRAIEHLLRLSDQAICAAGVISLPGQDSPTPGDSVPTADARVPTARRILVVDDNRASAESFAVLLTLTGNETDVADDGVPALGAAERFRPDVALLDVGLSNLSGGDTLEG
jgi:hypothetical protein